MPEAPAPLPAELWVETIGGATPRVRLTAENPDGKQTVLDMPPLLAQKIGTEILEAVSDIAAHAQARINVAAKQAVDRRPN